MPKKYTITYQPVQSPITEPITKSGGQPVWLEEPCWPLSREYGTPMHFICQIVLTADLFGDIEPRMAYLFLTDDEDATAETWDLDGGENAVILQPGGTWEGLSESRREGPTLCQRTSSGGAGWVTTPVELAVDLQADEDAEEGAWDDLEMKIKQRRIRTSRHSLRTRLAALLSQLPIPTLEIGLVLTSGSCSYNSTQRARTQATCSGSTLRGMKLGTPSYPTMAIARSLWRRGE